MACACTVALMQHNHLPCDLLVLLQSAELNPRKRSWCRKWI